MLGVPGVSRSRQQIIPALFCTFISILEIPDVSVS